MNTNEKFSLADLVIKHALKNGANQVSVSIQDNLNTSIEIRDQKIDTLQESNQSGLSVSLYTDKKYSAHSTNRMKEPELLKFVEEAILSTRYLAEDEYRMLPDPELYYKGGGQDLKIHDKKVETLDAKTKIGLATQALNEAYQKDDRIISVSSYYYDNISNQVMVSSNGFRGETGSSNISLAVGVSMKSENGRPSDSWYENSIFLDNLKTTGIGQKALERTIRKMEPRKIISGKYSVILENRAASRLLNPILSSLSGGNIYRKQSFLIDKIDKPIASSLLSITDDPLITSGFGSRLFDSEGFAAIKRPVIENGVLKSYYIDNYYGKKLKMNPTTGFASNLIFNTGTRSGEEMIASLKNGVLITGFIGGNSNGSTGDFSFGIEGFLIKDGKIIHPVNEMNISGNMNTFWFNLAEMGNDAFESQSYKTPSMLLENINLSGI